MVEDRRISDEPLRAAMDATGLSSPVVERVVRMQISLRKTLIVYTLTIVTCVSIGVAVSTLRATRTAVIQANDSYAKNLTQLLAMKLSKQDPYSPAIGQTLREIVEENEDLNAIALYDPNFQRVIEFSSQRQTVLILNEMRKSLTGFQSAYRQGHFSVVGPMRRDGKLVGYLGADFSLSRSSDLIHQAVVHALLVLVIGITAATLLAVLLAWKVTKPVFRLIQAAKKISKRQFDFRLPATRQRELQLLQNEIQFMVDELQATTVSRDYVDRIFQCMTDGLVVIDVTGEIRSANQAFCQLTRRNETDLLGTPLGEFVVDHRDLPYHPDKTPEQEDREGVDGRCLPFQACSFPVSITYNPIITQEQQLDGFVVSVKDITLRKQTESQRDEAMAKAEQANRVKSEFIANMSHELRTPMNSIIGFTRRLISKVGDQLSEQHLDALVTVDRNAKHLLGLINDILDLSKIEAGKMELNNSRFDLVRVVEEVLSQTAPLLDHRPLQMNRDVCEEPLWVDGDRVKMVQVVTNLISNAIKYTERGIVTVRLESDKNSAVLEVVDTGVGIREEDRQHLFQKFSQLDGSSTRQVGGTGLGLFITAQYIAMHGGTIDVESEYGRGSTFRVTLPLASRALGDTGHHSTALLDHQRAATQGDAARGETEMSAAESTGVACLQGRPAAAAAANSLTVLCVDDDLDTRRFLQMTLEDYGFRVITADGYDAALALAKACRPDLVCLDMKMSGKGGADVMEAFGADDTLKHLPVIVVSGESAEQVSESGVTEDDIRAFVHKPIDPNHLVNHIHTALASRLESVLLVEDNEDTLRLFTESFEEHGTRVYRAGNGMEALDILQSCRPSAIVTDLTMPVMGGVQFLEMLQKDEQLSSIPVIVLTARSLATESRESLSNLCQHIFTKGRDSTAHILVAALQAGSKPLEALTP